MKDKKLINLLFESRKFRKVALILVLVAYFPLFLMYFVPYAYSLPPQDSEWIISSDQTFTGISLTVNYPIRITSGAKVTFKNCNFNFNNETGEMYIIVEAASSLTLNSCILVDSTYGNSYITAEQNTNLTIIDSYLNNIGSSLDSAVKIASNYALIENTEFKGKYASIDASTPASVSYLEIKGCTFNDTAQYLRPAIHINDRSNITIQNNTIFGYLSGIKMESIGQNLTISSNRIIGCKERGIEGWFSATMPKSLGPQILSNNISVSFDGIVMLNSKHGKVSDNIIYAKKSGIILFNGYNQTIINNNLSILNSDSENFRAFQIIGENYLNITNNSLNVDISIRELQNDIGFYRLDGNIDITQQINNLFNGRDVLIYNSIINYSKTLNFSGQNLGAIYIFSCEGINIADLNISDIGALNLINSANLTASNITLVDPFEQLLVQNSYNTTISNSSVEFTNDPPSWPPIFIFESNETTLTNVNITSNQLSQINIISAVEIERSDDCNIKSINVKNFKEGIELVNSNNTLINSSYFNVELLASVIDYSSTNNFINNEINKLKDSLEQWEIYIDITTCSGNSFNKNHWSQNLDAIDETPKDGIADNPYLIFNGTGTPIFDFSPIFIDDDNDNLEEYQELILYNTDPNNNDTDNDKIDDGEEVKIGLDGFITNPLNNDTDNDKISDYDEINGTFGYNTDPTNRDTDNDLFSDYYEEIIFGSDPSDEDDYPGSSFNENDNSTIIEETEEPSNDISVGTIPGYDLLIIGLIIPICILCIFKQIKSKSKLNSKSRSFGGA
ncbi:MAG: right-handed parallel beta-helix repeat-containing protein [Promethearchaeota archaeon]